MNRVASLALFASVSLSFFVAGCASGGHEEPGDEEMVVGTSHDEAKESVSGPMGISGSPTEVWSIKNQWADRDTANAKLAGVSWAANSGLSWEEKYRKWVASFGKTDGASWGKTIQIPTPYGKTVGAPVLECAETAMFLRITFASWYHLPFYLEGWDSKGKQRMFAGHFGFVNASGARISPFPWFKTAYQDKEASWQAGQPWPSDAALRKMHLGGDDAVTQLEPGAGAGAYFDDLFLNKRAGYFARLALVYFGSANLADGANMVHIKPESIQPGDVLLERWQKSGIGHTIPVVAVTPVGSQLAVSVISGSMPRRQPLFEGPSAAKHYFTSEEMGGPGTAWDGNPYAKLGGGLRRFRTPVLKGGRWFSEVPKGSEAAYIPDADLAAIAARPEAFESLLSSGDPAARRKAALEVIEGARLHLRAHPSSCSAREKREDGFAMLYEVEGEAGRSTDEVDADYRKTEDYVFAPLSYNDSKTCCWNSTTAEMGDIILDFAKKEQDKAAAQGVCVGPTVFKSRADGYQLWKKHADSLGKGAQWKTWSADESCPQANVAEDKLGATEATAWCAIEH